MLDFIDTKLFVDGANIHVIVYSDFIEKAKSKVKSLILDEELELLRESKEEMVAVVLKDNVKVYIRIIPLSSHIIGFRSQYALIGREIIGKRHGEEILSQIIPTVQVYSHLTKSDYKLNNIIMF